MMAPQFKTAASQLPQVVFAKIQTDKYEQAAAPYNIRSLPTMVAFKNGREIARQSGALPSDQIVQWVQSLRSWVLTNYDYEKSQYAYCMLAFFIINTI